MAENLHIKSIARLIQLAGKQGSSRITELT